MINFRKVYRTILFESPSLLAQSPRSPGPVNPSGRDKFSQVTSKEEQACEMDGLRVLVAP